MSHDFLVQMAYSKNFEVIVNYGIGLFLRKTYGVQM